MEDPPHLDEEFRAYLGERYDPRRPPHEAGPEVGLEGLQRPRHDGRRLAEPARGGGETARLGHGSERRERVQTVHRIIVYGAMMFCSKHGFFPCHRRPKMRA